MTSPGPATRRIRTLPEAYAARLRSAAAAPLLTFYDLATGERVELSATTWINWAAKVAGLLTDELDLERGDRLHVDLGPHWQTSVILGGAWWAGVEVVAAGSGEIADAAVVACAEGDAAAYAETGATVLALSLKPMSGPCGPLPDGALDFGREVLPMPDAYTPLDPPQPDDVALRAGDAALAHADLLSRTDDARVLTDRSPASSAGATLIAGALASSGSVVLVRTHGAEVPASISEQEHVSRTDLAG